MTTLITARRPGFSVWPLALAVNAILFAFCVFAVTQAVKQHEARVENLNHQILAEQQTMRVLDAEWAYLSRPQRLEELMAMKEARDNMPPAPTPIAPLEDVVKEAKVEPAAGHSVLPKPKIEKPIAVKAEKKEQIAKVEKPKAAKAKATDADFVWSIKSKTPSVPTQMASNPKRAGVARPILE